MLERGRDIRERPQDEGALGEEQVRDVKVVGDAHHLVAVEEDVDVEGPWGEPLSLGRARGPRASELVFHRLDPREQHARRQ